MAYATFRGDGGRYVMTLTDGFVVDTRSEKGEDRQETLEKYMARRLYTYAKGLQCSVEIQEKRREIGIEECDPVHMWILGNDNWIANPPPCLEATFDKEDKSNYRIMIFGAELPKNDIFIANFGYWLRRAGMKHKKKHVRKNYVRFKSESLELLERMHWSYEKELEAPSYVLEDLGLPYEFFGD